MKYISHHWKKEDDGILFFFQRLEEMLFHYSDDIVRASVHNTRTLLIEYLKNESEVKKGTVKSYQLEPILEELCGSILGEYSFKKYWVFAKYTWNNIKFKDEDEDYSYFIQGVRRIMEIEDVDFKGLVINFESIRPEYYNGGKRFDISEKEGLLSSISVFTSFLEFIREARLSVDGFYDFLVKEATDNEIYLANKQGDNESNVEFIINRKIRLEKVKVEHIGSYIMLVQNIMAKEKIDIIELGKYSVCSNIDDLISKYSTADVPSAETILKWFKMYYKKTIATV